MKTENVYRELEKFYSSYNPDKERMTALAEKLYGKMVWVYYSIPL